MSTVTSSETPESSTACQYYISQPATGPLVGDIHVPGDKSLSNRALILSALAQGQSEIDGMLDAVDVLSTVEALRAMGVHIDHVDENYWVVHGVGMDGLKAPDGPIDCHHCGSTLRLLLGLLSAQSFDSELVGDECLSSRSQMHVVEPLREMGAKITTQEDGMLPIQIQGGQALQGIKYSLPLNNAQAKSSLLLVALFAQGKTTLVEPFLTRNHTEHLLEQFGYPVQTLRPSISLEGGGELKRAHVNIPGDMSAAAYFMVAASIVPDSDILLRNVGFNETRIGIINILRIMGARISIERDDMLGKERVVDMRVRYAPLQGVDIPIDQVPMAIDEFPVLFVAAACAKGVTTLREASELRFKDTDRIHTMAQGLRTLGVELVTRKDGIVIEGGSPIEGGKVNSCGDPRVAMAFAIAGLVAQDKVIVEDVSTVVESFPNFIALTHAVGADISETS